MWVRDRQRAKRGMWRNDDRNLHLSISDQWLASQLLSEKRSSLVEKVLCGAVPIVLQLLPVGKSCELGIVELMRQG